MRVKVWRTPSGRAPVTRFLVELSDDHAARLMAEIEHLGRQGLNLLDTHKVKQLQGHKRLYELRCQYKRINYRILFTTHNREIWLLEAFKKKGNQTPRKHIASAVDRQAQIIINSKSKE